MDVLKVLAGTTEPMTGRKVGRMSGLSPRSSWLALERLAKAGLVDRRDAGRATLYSLNREHLATPAVEILASLRTELRQRLRSHFEAWSPAPVHASLFGSAARGDGDVDSDIDVFLVRPEATEEDDDAWRDAVSRLHDHVSAWTGNSLGLIELAEQDLPALGARNPAVMESLRQDGIDLEGVPLRTLLPSQ